MPPAWDLFLSVFGAVLDLIRSYGRSSDFEPSPAFHVVGHIGQCDRRVGPGEANGADRHAHWPFLMGERVLDMGADP